MKLVIGIAITLTVLFIVTGVLFQRKKYALSRHIMSVAAIILLCVIALLLLAMLADNASYLFIIK